MAKVKLPVQDWSKTLKQFCRTLVLVLIAGL